MKTCGVDVCNQACIPKALRRLADVWAEANTKALAHERAQRLIDATRRTH